MSEDCFEYGVCCNCYRKCTQLLLPCSKKKSIPWEFKCKCAQIGIWYCLIPFCVGSNRITFIYLISEPRQSFHMKNSILKLQHSSASGKLLTSWQRFMVDGSSLCWHALFALKCWYHECIKKNVILLHHPSICSANIFIACNKFDDRYALVWWL